MHTGPHCASLWLDNLRGGGGGAVTAIPRKWFLKKTLSAGDVLPSTAFLNELFILKPDWWKEIVHCVNLGIQQQKIIINIKKINEDKVVSRQINNE